MASDLLAMASNLIAKKLNKLQEPRVPQKKEETLMA